MRETLLEKRGEGSNLDGTRENTQTHLSLACFDVGAFSSFLISSFSCATSSLRAINVGSVSVACSTAENDEVFGESKWDFAPGPGTFGGVVGGGGANGGGGGGGVDMTSARLSPIAVVRVSYKPA